MRLHLSACWIVLAASGCPSKPAATTATTKPVATEPTAATCNPDVVPEFAWADEVITPSDAARMLREAADDPDKARQLATMREIFYVADLSWASGSEADAGRLLRRFEEEFLDPHYVAASDVQSALDDMREIDKTFPPPPPRDDPEYDYYGWKKVAAMLEVVLGKIPSQGEAFEDLLRYPRELVVPFLIHEYQSDAFYHPYNMHNALFSLLTTNGFGHAVLAVVESRLRDGDPNEGPNNVSGVYWNDAVQAADEILGDDLGAWYCSIRGAAYADDRRVHAHAGKD